MKIENKISVILPVYNSEEFISESIKSIINQSYKCFELIIINDGSTDKTKEICESFLKKDKRIVLINNTHKGLTASLNEAIRISNGKYIARQDSDDISLPNRFEIQMKWFEKNKNGVLCGSDCKILNDDNRFKQNKAIQFSDYLIKKRLTYTNCFVHSSVIYLRKYAEKFGFYDENLEFAQDYDLWWKLSTVGRVGNIRNKLVIIRDRKNSISRNKSDQQTLSFINSCVKFYSFRKGLININENKELIYFEKNKITKDIVILMKYFYSDKLSNKLSFKNLSLAQILKIFFFPYLLTRKFFKNLKL